MGMTLLRERGRGRPTSWRHGLHVVPKLPVFRPSAWTLETVKSCRLCT